MCSSEITALECGGNVGDNDGNQGRCDSEDVPNKVAGSPGALAWPQFGRSLYGSVPRPLIHGPSARCHDCKHRGQAEPPHLT